MKIGFMYSCGIWNHLLVSAVIIKTSWTMELPKLMILLWYCNSLQAVVCVIHVLILPKKVWPLKKRRKKNILGRRHSGCWLKSVYLLFSQSCKVWGFLKWCSVFLVLMKGTLFLCLLSSAVMFKDFFVFPVILFYEPKMWVVSESIVLQLHAATSENLHSMFWYQLYFSNEKNH